MEDDRTMPADGEISEALECVSRFLVRRGVTDETDRETLAADIVVKALKGFDRQQGDFAMWAVSKIHYVILEYRRQKAREAKRLVFQGDLAGHGPDNSEEFEFVDPVDAFALLQDRLVLERLIERLLPLKGGPQMVYYVEACLANKTPAEIAADLGVPVSVVYKLQKQVVYHGKNILGVRRAAV